MNRRILFLLIAVLFGASGCSRGAPEVLAYSGPFTYAKVLVTVIVPGYDFIEYEINCDGDVATVDGTDKINANDACASLARGAVIGRLSEGQDNTRLCSQLNPEEGDLQVLGVVGEARINTFISRSDGCGQDDWDVLLDHIAVKVDELS